MAAPANVIVAQSGGPTPVINNSLRGVIEACRDSPDRFGRLFAGNHGIEGVLREELLDLSAQEPEEISLLSATPASGAVGTCRYKLKADQQADFERIIEVFKAQGVGFFFYIGGNDSMDTAHKVAQLAAERDLELVAVGVPKTIDNDIGDSDFKLIDHTPGYGSQARYWAFNMQGANEENAGSSPSDPVLVMQTMGRRIGFIPAAARLADPQREMPMLIFLPESGLGLAEIADSVNDMIRARGRALVVVSEGLDVGEIGERRDSFGHTTFASSQLAASQIVANHLNEVGLACPGAARYNVSGTDQRTSIIHASEVDLEEAYQVGRHAVRIALEDGSGFMATILRHPGSEYRVYYDKVPLELVANSERALPRAWIADPGSDVTDDFVRYARPLIGVGWPDVKLAGGLQRFARFQPIFAERKLPAYEPEAYR
jgi:6-phosphofructokinase 1